MTKASELILMKCMWLLQTILQWIGPIYVLTELEKSNIFALEVFCL